ncbi:PilZ domain-containing protein [Hoeflea sp. G2-23]|uniref:PilZ domain-containing protein n=1 Tax=Hoeflea algicola TaxID=2983763 RepID=A0ABT3Z5R4_9HYPH|nr:PilZ domain-containing protein [Hoeflea algicola]MCY0147117.1 PilZ domain-containing protein [Hoeflea algicola]
MKGFNGRAIQRDRTRLRTKIDCMGQKTPGWVLDLSQHGICLNLSLDIPVAIGDKITVETEEMGLLVGTIRWIRGPRIGAELVLTSNNRAKVESYYRMFRDNHQPA